MICQGGMIVFVVVIFMLYLVNQILEYSKE